MNRFPLERLRERGVLCLSVNNTAGWVPSTAFVCNDPCDKFSGGIFLDPKIIKFLPSPRARRGSRLRLKGTDGVFRWLEKTSKEMPSTFFFSRDFEFSPETFLASATVNCGCNDRGRNITGWAKNIFTPNMAFKLLYYLGVKEVFCLGLDFQMQHGQPYAYLQKKHSGAVLSNNEKYVLADKMFCALQPVFMDAGFHVFNVNETSGCTAFPYVPFSEALERCRNNVPPEPLDLSGYDETKNLVGEAATQAMLK